jgi:hypothetical protein
MPAVLAAMLCWQRIKMVVAKEDPKESCQRMKNGSGSFNDDISKS